MRSAAEAAAAALPGQGEAAREIFFRRLGDWLVALFALYTAVLVLTAPEDPAQVVSRVVLCLTPPAVLQILSRALTQRPQARLLWILRYATPLLFLTYYFRLTGQISPYFPQGYFDDWIMHMDGLLFGDPAMSMHFQCTTPFSSPLFGELMCLSYVAYFFFMPVFGGILILRGLWRSPRPSLLCSWYVACVVFVYYLHYFVFFLFPVEGPAFHVDTGIALDPGFIMNRLHHAIVSRGDVPGGCFPSSHVAVALVHTLIARRLGWRYLKLTSGMITVLICFSIVYTRTHYASDALGGLLSGALCWLLWQRIEKRPAAQAAPCRRPESY